MSLLTEAIVGLVATFSYWVQRIKSLSQINLQGLKLWKSQFSKSSIKACIFEVTFDSTGIPLSAVYRFGDKIHEEERTQTTKGASRSRRLVVQDSASYYGVANSSVFAILSTN